MQAVRTFSLPLLVAQADPTAVKLSPLKVPTRLTARVDGAPVAVLDIFLAKPEK
jgi:hypothetical protein